MRTGACWILWTVCSGRPGTGVLESLGSSMVWVHGAWLQRFDGRFEGLARCDGHIHRSFHVQSPAHGTVSWDQMCVQDSASLM